ncbi:hypothetical protein ACFO0N_08045 [Halobium salinum]|uniref:DUF7123 domain-containing protein n=1 Tax=Halobium salinum TaxID=1364940 RepID=A0ABD5PAZ9_9EURY|nr:hypothetical protein [Halobium salinum]
MSAPAHTETKGVNDKQRRILEYLLANAGSRTYFKSRLIGEAVGLSAKEVGANLAFILQSGANDGLDIEKWGYSSGTTWKVTPSERGG